MSRRKGKYSIRFIPIALPEYLYCYASPVEYDLLWPRGVTFPFTSAVPVEVAFDWLQNASGRFPLRTDEQDWPRDAVRYASTLGVEVAFRNSGLPIVGRDLLETRAPIAWDYLTLGLLQPEFSDDLEEWRECRTAIQESLLLPFWPAPRGCRSMVHVETGEGGFLLTRDRAILINWIASLLAERFAMSRADSSIPGSAAVAAWILDNASAVGVRLEDVRQCESHGHCLCVRGHWGRGANFGPSVGLEDGEAFVHHLSATPGE